MWHHRLTGLTCALLLSGVAEAVVAQELLQQLLQSAFVHHPAVRAQSGMEDAALANVAGAKWQYWPTPSINLERANTSDPSYKGDKSVTTLALKQPLWTGGAARRQSQ